MVDIKIGSKRWHTKASEEYIDVEFEYDGKTIRWDIPIVYRRTGIDFSEATSGEIQKYIYDVFEKCNPKNWDSFRGEQKKFWDQRPGASITKSFFDVLISDFSWKSIQSDFPPNPNWARRVQDLKELGYTISTNTGMIDSITGKTCTHLLLVPLPRGGITGYEIWTPELRARIMILLESYDAFEGKRVRPETLLPDHKFPEIRWDESTRRDSLETLRDEEIRDDFQLINNQRNQQKREACRGCFQSGIRPYPLGIKYFYKGDESWPVAVPRKGKTAERGCIGCGWYDLQAWRNALNRVIKESDQKEA
jgi:hypothetical protein